MARYGKIARLPRHIREELIRRMENGDSGVQLVAWLNELEEVRQVLKEAFGGQEISEQNLSAWKAHGYVELQAKQDSLALARELKADATELNAESAGELTNSLATVVAVGYASALYGWTGEFTDEMRARLRGLKGLSREIIRLRQADQMLEQTELQREWLALANHKKQGGDQQ